MQIAERVWQTIAKYHLSEDGSSVIVGCSGGPDSVGLVLVLRDLSQSGVLDLKLHVAHLNHMTRGDEGDEDQRFVRKLASNLGLTFHTETVNVPELREKSKGNLEETARHERYAFLQRVAEDVGAKTIAVGHTADDQAETVLHRVLRGTGLHGLVGIPVRRELRPTGAILVRPLLQVTHQNVLDHLHEKGQGYRLDSSNKDTNFTRNLIRLEIMPLVEREVNSGVRDALVRLGEIASQAHDYLEEEAFSHLDEVLLTTSGDNMTIDARKLLALPQAMQPLVIRLAIRQLKGCLQGITRKHIDRLLDFAATAYSGKTFQLPQNVTVIKEYGKLRMQEGSSLPGPHDDVSIELCVPGKTLVPDMGFEVCADVFDEQPGFLKSFQSKKTPLEETMDLDTLRLPLILRTWHAGDRMRPLGICGTKKLQDMFTDRKVPRERRSSVPVITMQNDQPIWVVGLGIDESVKIRDNTKRMLHLKLVTFGTANLESRL